MSARISLLPRKEAWRLHPSWPLSRMEPQHRMSSSHSSRTGSFPKAVPQLSFSTTLQPRKSPPQTIGTRRPALFAIERGVSAVAPYVTTNCFRRFDIQDRLQNKFEITMRDPYMNEGSLEEGSLAPHWDTIQARLARLKESGDECPPGSESWEGDACVVAVIRFDQALAAIPMNVTTFDGETGEKINTTFVAANETGVVILKVPVGEGGALRRIFASVNYREDKPGTFGGTDYDFVDHWATTSGQFARPTNGATNGK